MEAAPGESEAAALGRCHEAPVAPGFFQKEPAPVEQGQLEPFRERAEARRVPVFFSDQKALPQAVDCDAGQPQHRLVASDGPDDFQFPVRVDPEQVDTDSLGPGADSEEVVVLRL